jgi:hypothetical protein
MVKITPVPRPVSGRALAAAAVRTPGSPPMCASTWSRKAVARAGVELRPPAMGMR